MTADQWAELRQVGFATLDHEAAVRTATELLELDAFLPRDEWFWDSTPAAEVAQASRSTKVDDIVAVDVAVDMAAIAFSRRTGTAGELCNTLIRFV